MRISHCLYNKSTRSHRILNFSRSVSPEFVILSRFDCIFFTHQYSVDYVDLGNDTMRNIWDNFVLFLDQIFHGLSHLFEPTFLVGSGIPYLPKENTKFPRNRTYLVTTFSE